MRDFEIGNVLIVHRNAIFSRCSLALENLYLLNRIWAVFFYQVVSIDRKFQLDFPYLTWAARDSGLAIFTRVSAVSSSFRRFYYFFRFFSTTDDIWLFKLLLNGWERIRKDPFRRNRAVAKGNKFLFTVIVNATIQINTCRDYRLLFSIFPFCASEREKIPRKKKKWNQVTGTLHKHLLKFRVKSHFGCTISVWCWWKNVCSFSLVFRMIFTIHRLCEKRKSKFLRCSNLFRWNVLGEKKSLFIFIFFSSVHVLPPSIMV